MEGAHAVEDNIDNVEELYHAGIRMMSATHFADNLLGGSAHGVSKAGLTAFGKQVIKKMESLRMIIDVSHSSSEVIEDILDMCTTPLVASHSGVRGTCNNSRNLSDEHVKRIAKTGGIINIGYWKEATCGDTAEDVAKAIKYTVSLVGIDHVGLGSDYDGGVKVPFATDKLVELTQALVDENFTKSEIEKIMGQNLVRLLLDSLPVS